LNYLCLDKIKDCALRVQQRVSEGGHNVDARTIKGVYELNLKYVNDYKETFRLLNLFDGTRKPALMVSMEEGKVLNADVKALKKNWIKIGLPSIYGKIEQFLHPR